ncbi:hypothetical protein ZWY2020_039699 [Hordeum vulgare]|nr:hypothetical protein ZWY2020_039699 [Hordeum vulgare]
MEETAEEQAAAPAAVEFGDTAENGMEEEASSLMAEEDAAIEAAYFRASSSGFDIWRRGIPLRRPVPLTLLLVHRKLYRHATVTILQIEIKTSPADFRFPTTNQTRHCFTRYVEFHGCVGAKGDEAVECDKFAKYYRSLCPAEWVDKWNEQRENGTFAGPL